MQSVLVGEIGRLGYSCADNTKMDHENLEEPGKPQVKVQAS
jgi:hypothetical protein